MLSGSYTLLLFDEARCNQSSPSLCSMQPGLVSSNQPTTLAGKTVYELVDPSKPLPQAPYVIELPISDMSLLDGSTQLLLNTTDGQPQGLPELLEEPWASLHTAAGNLYNAPSQRDLKRSLERSKSERPTRTWSEKARKTRDARPKSARPVNSTVDLGDDNENGGELLRRTPLIWFFAALAVFIVV